jgi:hydroxymethylglutaryl-CoA reductase (NADPH)
MPVFLSNADYELFKKIRKSYDKNEVKEKREILERSLNVLLNHVGSGSYDPKTLIGNIENPIGVAQIPLGVVGPISISGNHAKGDFFVPMATTEGALVLTYDLGVKLFQMSGPIQTEVVSKVVHITPMFPINSDEDRRVGKFVEENYEIIKKEAEKVSNHTTLLGIEQGKAGTNFLLKFKYDTGDAQGLNMINHATFSACKYIESKTGANFYHRSHYSGVKHYSPLNEEKGYGRVVKASGVVSAKALYLLKVSAAKLKDYFDRCIECGVHAGIKSVNVHASNGISAIYVACGQDVADISSSHTCSTTVKEINGGEDLRVDVVLKNLLVATVGGGTSVGTQKECLQIMDCFGSGNSDKFAEIVAATVLAGEVPTAAAVVNKTYVDTHNKYGRKPKLSK